VKLRGIMFLIVMLASVLAARAQQPITLERAMAMARARAPQILSAQDRIDEARGRMAGASILVQENPTIDGTVGPRYSLNGNTTDYDISISQPFELGGRRGARIASARAGVDREAASSRDVARRLLREVSVAFVRGLAAKERLSFAEAASRIASELLQSMNLRFDTGDVPVLDVNLARNGAARARAEVRTAQAAYTSAIGDLRILLGMNADETLEIIGDLQDRKRFELATLTTKAGDRPDLQALAAEKAEAQADIRLAKGFHWPTVAPAFTYKRDQGDRVVQGGVSFTLPIFNRGQELQAVGEGRTRRIEREMDATKRAVSVEVRTAYDVYNLQVAAVEELERDALPSLMENETLARRSFEEGEIGLAELLFVRRDAFEIRNVYTERLLEAAVAGIELESRAGVLQ
jgi:outer membrane protein, heavy metal efflux system